MKKILGWLARLWKGVPEHATKHDPKQPWSDPNHDVMGDVRAFIESDRFRKPPPGLTNIDLAYKQLRKPPPIGTAVERDMPPIVPADKPPTEIPQPPSVSDRDLLTDNEKALWADIEGDEPKPEPIAYPLPAEQTTQEWVTERLQELTGGLTRHPADRTQYPTPPTEADLAAREMFPIASFAMSFSHGMSMQHLGRLKARAEQRDRTLTAEELMSLRARGLA